ncbi:phage integrase central domain-containing protein [Achromobacter spanius]|uniref:Phage integrase central domain-containing protein n=1 Tax=Achromobacter spanius TaxID=217203 RepID=A0AA42LPU6_9BURK|nr:hypothetical protein [Achromobacter spanius]MDH0737324.1 hypothetical protein [Achromobacter spanius]
MQYAVAVRKSAYKRAIEPALGKLKVEEVTPQRLMKLCDEAKEKRGPAVAVDIRESVLAVFRHAHNRGVAVNNEAEAVKIWRYSNVRTTRPRVVASRDSHIPGGIGKRGDTPTLRLTLKFVLLIGVRKSEFIDATWGVPYRDKAAPKSHILPAPDVRFQTSDSGTDGKPPRGTARGKPQGNHSIPCDSEWRDWNHH